MSLYLGERQMGPGPSINPNSTEYCDLKILGKLPPNTPIPNLGPATISVVWSFLAVSTVFLVLRLYCKIWRSRGLWWDDYVLAVAWLSFLADAILIQRVINHGFGHYPCDIGPPNLSFIAFEGAGLGSMFSILAIVWSKTSFALTILRISKDKLRWLVWFLIVSMNIVMLLQALFVWIKCKPIEKNWKPLLPGHCWDTEKANAYGMASGVYSGLCDILLALLPWRLVWGLQMRRKEKIGVVVAMSMGVFAGITAFVKSTKLLKLGSKNFSYEGSALLIWTAIEIGTTIIAACIPVLRVLFRELREGSSKRYHHNSSGGSSHKLGSLKRNSAALVSPKLGKDNLRSISGWGWDLSKITYVGDIEEAVTPPARVSNERVTNESRERILRTADGEVPPLLRAGQQDKIQQVLGEEAVDVPNNSNNGGYIVQTSEYEVRYEGGKVETEFEMDAIKRDGQ